MTVKISVLTNRKYTFNIPQHRDCLQLKKGQIILKKNIKPIGVIINVTEKLLKKYEIRDQTFGAK